MIYPVDSVIQSLNNRGQASYGNITVLSHLKPVGYLNYKFDGGSLPCSRVFSDVSIFTNSTKSETANSNSIFTTVKKSFLIYYSAIYGRHSYVHTVNVKYCSVLNV